MGWLEDWLEKHGIMEETMPEWDEPDGLSPEDAWGQLAKETYPELDLGDEPTDLTTLGGNAILKEIHFEGIYFRNDIGHQVRKKFSKEN